MRKRVMRLSVPSITMSFPFIIPSILEGLASSTMNFSLVLEPMLLSPAASATAFGVPTSPE